MGLSGVHCSRQSAKGGPTTVTTPLNPSIPEGLCQCGCGQNTSIATSTCTKRLQFKGKPLRFIPGHQGYKRVPLEEALPFKIDGVYCRLIPLTQGLHAIVNESDYAGLMQWKWHADYEKRTQTFYATRKGPRINGKQETISMQRQMLGLERGEEVIGDHANRVTLDYRRKNIRAASAEQNEQNRKISKANTSGFKGVTFNQQRRKWAAYIRVNGRKINLGQRATAAAAGQLYADAALKYHKEFARTA